MTQIIFHIAAIACIVYTVCRFGLFIHKRMRKNKNIGKHVHVPPPETSGKAEPGYLGRHRLYICLKGCHQHVFNSNR